VKQIPATIFNLWWASVALQFGVCVRLMVTGLWNPYRRFICYLGALAIESCVLLKVSHDASLYGKVWFVTRLILLPFVPVTALGDIAPAAAKAVPVKEEAREEVGSFGD